MQTSGMHSDITADTAISNVITKDAKRCVLVNTEKVDEYLENFREA